MAKKTAALTTASEKSTAVAAVARASYSGDFVGTFTGPLKGNADTASRLQNSFRITVTGDASGHADTSGNNTTLNIAVTRASNAMHADVADTAVNVEHATTSNTASYAKSAGTAANASKASEAEHAVEADHAGNADHAINADAAVKANEAVTAGHAKTADKATAAEHADTAAVADIAKALDAESIYANEAEHAKFADLARIAQYDCNGLSFTEFYALKTDIPKDFLTIDEAKDLFVPRKEQVLQAVVCGKATGHGFLDGNTLRILISSLALDGDQENIYGSFEFVDKFIEDTADTTKVYIDRKGQEYGHMYVFDQEVNDFGAPGLGHWVEITSRLDKETQEALDEALAKINDVVTIHGDQIIKDHKAFENTVTAEIADLDNDDPRTVVTVHNLNDVKDRLTTMIEAAAGTGWEWALVDYTLAENQIGMPVHKSYWGLRAEDKSYIAINPETGQPLDSSAVVKYIRHFRKASNGSVVYFDVAVTDHSVFARLDGADFTGPVHVPSIDLDAEPSNLAINFMDVKHLVKDMIEDAQVGKVWMFLGERPKTTEEIPAERIGLYEFHPEPIEEDYSWTYMGGKISEELLANANVHDVLLFDAEEKPIGEYDIIEGQLYPTEPSAVALHDHQIVLIQKDFNPEGGIGGDESYDSDAILSGRLFTTYPKDLDLVNHEVVIYQDTDKTLIKD